MEGRFEKVWGRRGGRGLPFASWVSGSHSKAMTRKKRQASSSAAAPLPSAAITEQVPALLRLARIVNSLLRKPRRVQRCCCRLGVWGNFAAACGNARRSRPAAPLSSSSCAKMNASAVAPWV